MTELWIPQPDKQPNVDCIYDMMLVFQEYISGMETYEAQFAAANIAIRSLVHATRRLSVEEQEVSVVSGLAMFDSLDGEDALYTVEDVGMRGSINSIQGVRASIDEPITLHLNMDVHSVFLESAPDAANPLFGAASAPINKIKYIETLQA